MPTTDCLIVGFYDPDFEEYEQLIRTVGSGLADLPIPREEDLLSVERASVLKYEAEEFEF